MAACRGCCYLAQPPVALPEPLLPTQPGGCPVQPAAAAALRSLELLLLAPLLLGLLSGFALGCALAAACVVPGCCF
ncbi:hypothetical protein Acr_11g0005650 [Actinidia rufa]|uniref:Uncharacterized protein n=1 Tax=Actinidia rufa TaxID=165716 RepID=A0A7J0FDF7_9ERIC|nr:hypothetical protein Acr_11g0005650 [Actinidia rufa]